MAAIDDNDLRPEEEIGGFNSETPGDDSFFSENQDAYPGPMPDYSEYEDESPASEPEKAVPAAALPVSTNKKRYLLKILVVAVILILISAIAADIYRSNRDEKAETSEDIPPQNTDVIDEVVKDDQSVYSEPVSSIEVIDDFVEPMIIEDQFLTEAPKSDDVIIDRHNTTRTNKPSQTASKKPVSVKPDPINKPDIKPTVPPKNNTGRLYTVQIYSSPSKDDAEAWLARLIKKNVDNAFITTKKIRNTMMYRVRFGAFSTQAEAKKAAIKQGFDQTWIDRVR